MEFYYIRISSEVQINVNIALLLKLYTFHYIVILISDFCIAKPTVTVSYRSLFKSYDKFGVSVIGYSHLWSLKTASGMVIANLV